MFAAGTVGSQVIALVTVPFVTAHISAADFGSVDLVTTVVSLLLPLASLSVGEAVLRFGMDRTRVMQGVVSSGFAVGLVGCLVCLGLWPLAHFSQFPLRDYFWFGYVMLCALTLRDVASGYLRAANRIKMLVAGGIGQSILYAVLVFALLGVIPAGLNGYLSALCLSSVLLALFFTLVTARSGELRAPAVDRKLIARMLRYSVPLVPNALLWWVVTSASRFFLLASRGAEAVGLYAVAVRVTTVLVGLTGVFLQAWQLSAIEESESHDRRRFESSVFGAMSGAMFVCTSVLLLALRPLISLFFADAYYDSWLIVPPLLLAVIFLTFGTFAGAEYKVRMTTGRALGTSAAGALVAVFLSAIMIPGLGAIGAGLATCGGYGVLWALRLLDVGLPLASMRQRIAFGVSLLILCGQGASMYWSLPFVGSLSAQIAACALLLILNGHYLIPVVSVLRNLRSRHD